MGKTFKYVSIPVDLHEEVRELEMTYTEEDSVGCLVMHLQKVRNGVRRRATRGAARRRRGGPGETPRPPELQGGRPGGRCLPTSAARPPPPALSTSPR